MIEVFESTFDKEVIEASQSKLVVVDFMAHWCNPCKMMKPMLDELSQEYKDKFTLVYIDVDKAHVIASKYRIRSVPTIMVFREGEMVASRIGAITKGNLITYLEAL